MIKIGTQLINGKIVSIERDAVVVRRTTGSILRLPFDIVEAQMKAIKRGNIKVGN